MDRSMLHCRSLPIVLGDDGFAMRGSLKLRVTVGRSGRTGSTSWCERGASAIIGGTSAGSAVVTAAAAAAIVRAGFEGRPTCFQRRLSRQ
mmetsp:Transcript_14404/g.22065  ORF Transcript_14404/g.22065 Transcript_14404/m.22065 type:complete len:90 (-) Transcript_14404:386-655(-)